MKKVFHMAVNATLAVSLFAVGALGVETYKHYRAGQDPNTLHLCHMFNTVNLGSIVNCFVHTMPDGTRAIIERGNTTTPYLLDLFNKMEQRPQEILPFERIDETNPYVFTA